MNEDQLESSRKEMARRFDLDWSNAPLISELREDVTRGLSEISQHHSKISEWLKNREAPPVQARKGRSRITPKLIRKQAEWRYASLSEPFLANENIFDSLPRTAMDKQAADANRTVLNYQMNHQIKKVKFIDDYIRAAVDTGTAILKVGWQYDTAVEVSEIVKYDQNGEPYIDVVEEEVVINNHPTVEVCNYRAVIPDPTCEGDLSKANFVAYRYTTSLKELNSDGRYRNLDELVNVAQYESEISNTSFEFADKARKKFEVTEYWGYWDVYDNGTVEPILVVYAGNTVIRMEINPYPNGKPPFIMVPYMPVDKSLYGEPDAELISDNQDIIGAITRGTLDLLGRNANAQTGIRQGFLDSTNRKRFEEGNDYYFNQGNATPESAIYQHKFSEIPNSVFQFMSIQNNEAESLTGIKGFHGGISGETLGKTATSARGALSAASQREMGILRRLMNGIVELGYHFMSMNAEFLSDVEQVRIHKDEFQDITKDSLYGDVDIILSISTLETDNAKAEDLTFMLQTMGNSLPLQMTQYVLAEIAKLRKMPDLARAIEEYEPQPDPMQEYIQQLQAKLLEAEIMYTHARAQEHLSGAGLKGAKVPVEQARANNLQNKADLDNLNFVKEVSGDRIREDLQRLRAELAEKTRANLDEKAGEAMLNQGFDLLNRK